MIKEILDFENRIQGYKTRVKELHFAAKKHSIHEIMDEFDEELGEFEDSVMEDAQAIHSQYTVGELSPVLPSGMTEDDLLREIRADLITMKEFFEGKPMYTGCLNELEDFFHQVNKTIYLVRLANGGSTEPTATTD